MKSSRYLGIRASSFFENETAVLGLPMRLTVSVIIGIVALSAILSFTLNPCIFPKRMIVTVTPLVLGISENETITITVTVRETDGHPIKNARVLIKGLQAMKTNITNKKGETSIQMRVILQEGIYEGYLDVNVKAPCHEPFLHENMVKVVKD